MKNILEDVISFRNAITKETDRGCALFATSYLDKSLLDLLCSCLVNDRNINKELFEGSAPLSSFSSRIKMAYYLGKISKSAKRDLDILRTIRNEFAHSSDEITFDKENIKSKCSSLEYSYHNEIASPRAHFTSACMKLLSRIHEEMDNSQHKNRKSDDIPSEVEKESFRKRRNDLINIVEKILNEEGEGK